jgi:hypothetical protein
MIETQPEPTAWIWPSLQRQDALGALRAASFIEWRYYAVLSSQFHGIVGLALVNPRDHYRAVAESGLLVIIAGTLGAEAAGTPDAAPMRLCWMHLFPTSACAFDVPASGGLTAGDADCCIALTHSGPAAASIQIEAGAGLRLSLEHTGLPGAALPRVDGRDLDGIAGARLFKPFWNVDCPSPVASTTGVIELTPGFLDGLPTRAGAEPGFVTPALVEVVRREGGHFGWTESSGYYEHSWGVRPLPLHGWDFLFVPDAERGQSVVLQTYRGSRALRYAEVCWRDGDALRRHRFAADRLRLSWSDALDDPLLGVRRPLGRRIEARGDGLQLELTSRLTAQVPLLRRRKLAVRHFFISEEMGVADWRLTDSQGRTLAEASGQRCGGEIAHLRVRSPKPGAS